MLQLRQNKKVHPRKIYHILKLYGLLKNKFKKKWNTYKIYRRSIFCHNKIESIRNEVFILLEVLTPVTDKFSESYKFKVLRKITCKININMQNMYSHPIYAYRSEFFFGRYPTVAWVQNFTPVHSLQVRVAVLHRGEKAGLWTHAPEY